MLAAVINKPNDLEMKEVPTPMPKPNEALVRVKACGVCGTDVHIFKGEFISPYPIIPGHELAGIVEQVGAGVTRVKPGDAVAVDPSLFCENCYFCVQNKQNHCENWNGLGNTVAGAFAEFVAVPEANLFKTTLKDLKHAAFVEPLACVIYGHERARMSIGDSVLIFGSGPIGLLHLQVALKAGASAVDVVDLKPGRLEIARSLGARNTFKGDDPDLTKALRDVEPRGYDLVIDATGVPKVVENAIQYVKNSGKLLIFGVCPPEGRISISPFEIYKRDLEIIGSFAIKKTYLAALRMMESGYIKVDPLIGGVFPLPEFPTALELMASGRADMKLIVTP
ncbi:MAG: zinc-dependent alcohol dehydrogenase family protein [Firmicutes bacterium]|nr:zinc-dependent alcohol dehydrogenase family protein [Bacillota bacterium]